MPKRAPKGRTSTAQANDLGPRDPFLFWPEALEGRNRIAAHTRTAPRPDRWIYHALSGLANPTGMNFSTQAGGLGFVRSPLWG